MKRDIFFAIVFFFFIISMNAQETSKIKIKAGTSSFDATLADNASARAFASLLPLTVTMEELNGNEKFHNLSGKLPSSPARQTQIKAGDLMLYGDNCIVLFYETFTTSYTYTRIGAIDNPSGLKKALGPDNPTVIFELSPRSQSK